MEGFGLKPRQILKLVKEGEGLSMTRTSVSHPQLPLGLGLKCWAMPAFSDQEQALSGGMVHLCPSYGSLRHLSITSC